MQRKPTAGNAVDGARRIELNPAIVIATSLVIVAVLLYVFVVRPNQQLEKVRREWNSPEAAAEGPIALIRDGDIIAIDAKPQARSIGVELSDEELARRRATHIRAERGRLGGLLEKYAAVVGPANLGAVTHSGNFEWPRDV